MLYLVVSVSKKYIQKHKKLTEFVVEDYELLLSIVESEAGVLLTPNTLTETSNLIRYIEEPAKTEIINQYNQLVANAEEQYIESKIATQESIYRPLGIADTVLLQLLDDENTLITTDLELYLSALSNHKEAFNFNHLRDSYLN